MLDQRLLLLALEVPRVLAVLLAPRPNAVPLVPRLLEGPLPYAFAIHANPHRHLLALPARGKTHPPLKGFAATPRGGLDH